MSVTAALEYVSESYLALVTPARKADALDIERIRAAITFPVFAIAACVMAVSEYLFFTSPPNYSDSVFVFGAIAAYIIVIYVLKYTKYTEAGCYMVSGSIGFVCLGMYVTTEISTEGKGEHEEGLLMCAAALFAVVLPAQTAIVFCLVYFGIVVSAMSMLDRTYGSNSASRHFVVMMFLVGCIIATCLVRYYKTKRIELQSQRLQMFLDASLQGMAVIDVSEFDGMSPRRIAQTGRREGWYRGRSGTASQGSTAPSTAYNDSEADGDYNDDDLSSDLWTELILHHAIIDHNNSFAAMFGGEEALEGKSLSELLTITGQVGIPGLNASASGCDYGGNNGMVTTIYEAVASGGGGVQFDCEIAVHRFATGGKKRLGIVALRDTTERNRIARAAKSAEIEQKTTSARAEFLDTISHELRNPVHAIVGMSEILLDEVTELPGTIQSYVQIVATSAQTLLSIVNQVLEFSKINSEGIKLHNEPTGLVGFLETLVTEVAVMAKSKGLCVTYDYNKQLDNVFLLDSTRLSQILRNFTTNAVKYTESGGVGIVAKCKSETATHATILLEVHDTGNGIAPEDQERIFERFTMLGDHKVQNGAKFASTGLGLAIAAKIVQAFDGKISVHSQPGVGSTFGITLELEKYGGVGTSYRAPPLLSGCRVAVFEPIELLRVIEVSHLTGEGANATPVSTFEELIMYVCTARSLPHGALSLRPLSEEQLRLLSAAVVENVGNTVGAGRRPRNRFVLVTSVCGPNSAPPPSDLCEYMTIVRTPSSPLNSALTNAFVRHASNLPTADGMEETFMGSCKLESESLSRSHSLLEASYGIGRSGKGGNGNYNSGGDSGAAVSRSPWSRRNPDMCGTSLEDTFEFMSKIVEASNSNPNANADGDGSSHSLEKSLLDSTRLSLSGSNPMIEMTHPPTTPAGLLPLTPAPLPATLRASGARSSGARDGRGGVSASDKPRRIASPHTGGGGGRAYVSRSETATATTAAASAAAGESGLGVGQADSPRRGLALEPDSDTDSSEAAYAVNPGSPGYAIPLHEVHGGSRASRRADQSSSAHSRSAASNTNPGNNPGNSSSGNTNPGNNPNGNGNSQSLRERQSLGGTSSSNGTWVGYLDETAATAKSGVRSPESSVGRTTSAGAGGIARFASRVGKGGRANGGGGGGSGKGDNNAGSGSGGGGGGGGSGGLSNSRQQSCQLQSSAELSESMPGRAASSHDNHDDSSGGLFGMNGSRKSLQRSGGLRGQDSRSLLSNPSDSLEVSSCSTSTENVARV